MNIKIEIRRKKRYTKQSKIDINIKHSPKLYSVILIPLLKFN